MLQISSRLPLGARLFWACPSKSRSAGVPAPDPIHPSSCCVSLTPEGPQGCQGCESILKEDGRMDGSDGVSHWATASLRDLHSLGCRHRKLFFFFCRYPQPGTGLEPPPCPPHFRVPGCRRSSLAITFSRHHPPHPLPPPPALRPLSHMPPAFAPAGPWLSGPGGSGRLTRDSSNLTTPRLTQGRRALPGHTSAALACCPVLPPLPLGCLL